jgi:hypothetical protein
MVDDATGHTVGVVAEEETTEAAMRLVWAWVERRGIPRALYVDGKNVYVTEREPTVAEQLAGEEPRTAFGEACHKLGMEIIEASSPQAKGRVERKHGVFQDRFVKELALRRITTIETANTLLQNGFMEALNAKFAHAPLGEEDFHRPVPPGLDLADVFCFEHWRTVTGDWTIRYDNQYYQILKENRPLPQPGEKVLVRVRLDKTRVLLYQDKPLAYKRVPLAELRRKSAEAARAAGPESEPFRPPKTRHKPPADHPWRKAALGPADRSMKF